MSLPESVLNTARALVLISLIFGFLAIWVWAWRKKRKPAFHDASMLPLEEDEVENSTARGDQE